MYPLPAVTLAGRQMATARSAIARANGAGCLAIGLTLLPDATDCAMPPPRGRSAGSHPVDTSACGGRLVPVLLRADGDPAVFAALPLQARLCEHEHMFSSSNRTLR